MSFLVLTCLSLSGAVTHKAKRLLLFTIAKNTPQIHSILQTFHCWEYHCWVLSEMCCWGICLLSLSLSLPPSLPRSLSLSLYLSICAHGCKCCEGGEGAVNREEQMSLPPSPLALATVAPCTPTFPMFFAWALGEGGFTSVGRVSEKFNNRQFQFVRATERVVVEWLVLGSWKHIRIKEPLGSSYFKRRKDPPSSGYQEGTRRFKAVNWLFAIFGGGVETMVMYQHQVFVSFGESWLWTALIPGEGLVRFLIPAQHWFLGW